MHLPAAVHASRDLADAPGRRSRALWAALCALLVGVVAVADVLTGYEMNLSILYLAPVLLATWTLGLAAGIVFVAVSLGVWVASIDFMEHTYHHPFYRFWDAAIRVVTWSAFAVMLAQLRIALARADERFVTVLAGLDAVVYVADTATGELLYANERCAEQFGRNLRNVRELQARLHGSEASRREVQDTATGRWYLLAVRPIRWTDGRPVRLHIASDITDRMQVREIARREHERVEMTSRLTALGEMASTLAHEINQPLFAISNYCSGCIRRLRAGGLGHAELLDALEKSALQADRAAAVVQRARDFLRKREPELAPCELNAVIESVATLLLPEAEEHAVRLHLELAPLPGVPADRVMIEQVLLNLARNALQSMQDAPAPERVVTVRTFLRDGAVEVEVGDRGPGLPPELRRNLFVAFFTTKPDGMGMGLQICRSIVERHGGRLWAEPNPGGGSIFRFTLPLASP